jgi:hypothetical protein
MGHEKATLMATKVQKHKWPVRPHTERRLHSRVKACFPFALDVGPSAPALHTETVSIGLGGVRITVDHYIELFTRFTAHFELPVSNREGKVVMTTIKAPVVVVDVHPDEEGPPGIPYQLSFSFSRLTEDDERVIAIFLLQTLLYDPEASLA